MTAFIITSAIIIDALLGEARRYHPLVGFGHCANYLERIFNHPLMQKNHQTESLQADKQTDISTFRLKNFLMGLISTVALVCPIIALTYFLTLPLEGSFYTYLIDIFIVYWAIGLQSLRQHVAPIQVALNTNNIELARKRVSFIVSRNTEQLNKQEITKAAIETTLENGNDALFAVLFCYVVGGVELVVAYRLINTLDAMWGYRNNRFEFFGKTVAKLDDLLNFIPARLTALSYSICGNFKVGMCSWFTQAALLKSPNAGPVMTAGAGSLDLQLGGNTYYHGKLVEKPLFGGKKDALPDDIGRSINLVYCSTIIWVLAILLITKFHSI